MKTVHGIYAKVSFLGEEVAILYGNPAKAKFIRHFQQTNDTEIILKLITNDLGFSIAFPFDEEEAMEETSRLQQEGQEVWAWRREKDDPVDIVFGHGLYLEKERKRP